MYHISYMKMLHFAHTVCVCVFRWTPQTNSNDNITVVGREGKGIAIWQCVTGGVELAVG